MDRRNEDTALLALRGGLRGRFRRSFDSMENAFEVLQDRLQHAVNPAERAELMPLLEELQTQLICLRRLGDQASECRPRRRCCCPLAAVWACAYCCWRWRRFC